MGATDGRGESSLSGSSDLIPFFFIGPLTVCLSTLSLLSVAEDYYTKMGFHLKRKDYFSGYDLDVFEKQIE